MKKAFRNICAVSLAGFLFVLSVAGSLVPSMKSFAATEDLIDATEEGSFTIYKYDATAAAEEGVVLGNLEESTGERMTAVENTMEAYAVKGVEFTYLRMGDVEQFYDETTHGTQLIYQLPAEVITCLGLQASDVVKEEGTAKFYSADTIRKAMQKALEDNTNTKNVLENYIVDQGGTSMSLTNERGVTSVDQLALGLYLIVETKVPENVVSTVDPFFVELPFTDGTGERWMYDAHVYPKNQTGYPTLDEIVRKCPGDADENHMENAAANFVTSEDLQDTNAKKAFASSRTEYSYQTYTQASQGDYLDYLMISKLPHITSEATYVSKYVLQDNLSKGIAYQDDLQIAFYSDRAAAYANRLADAEAIWAAGSDKFNAAAKAIQEGEETGIIYGSATKETASHTGTLVTIQPTLLGLAEINEKYSDMYMVAYYTGQLNADATTVLGDSGNPNETSLEWRRTSVDHSDVLKDETYVYTYGFRFQKRFAPAGADATQVRFVCENKSDHYFLVADQAEEGLYYITGKSQTEAGGTSFVPAADGTLRIYGAEADTYDLTETHTAQGYHLLKEPITFKVNGTQVSVAQTMADISGTQHKTGGNHDDQSGVAITNDVSSQVTQEASAVVVDKENTVEEPVTMSAHSTALVSNSQHGVVDYYILNSIKFELPQTGGMGTMITAIGGTALVFVGFVLLNRKKKERNFA